MHLMLAPMAELSHRALRELILGFFAEAPPHGYEAANSTDTGGGCLPEFFTEMTSAPALLSGGPFEQWYLDGGPRPERLVYQLTGAAIDPLAAAAALLDRRECLGIDLNMGCAAPAITRTGAGVRWMEDPDRAARLVEAVRGATKKRLSVKLRLPFRAARLGPKTPAGGTAETAGTGTEDLPGLDYLVAFCRRLEDAGAELITLHPRGPEEKFKRRARWEYVYRLREALGIPVAGNGDIASAAELAAAGQPGGDQPAGPVMAGRLAVKEPWVFAAVMRANAGAVHAAADAAEKTAVTVNADMVKETGVRFLELLARYQPPEFHVSRARRFFHYYCANLQWAEYLRNALNREESLAGMERVWREHADI